MCFYAKALLNMMASQLSGELLQREREIFKTLDRDGSGTIGVDELTSAIGALDVQNRGRVASALRHFDLDRSGSITFNEWIGATMHLDIHNSRHLKARAQSIFSQLDADGSGKIEIHE